MNSKKKIAQGYVFLKPFNGIYLPTYIQNILIKNLCDQKKFQFNLSINEHNIKNCWMELFSLVKKKNIDVIIMTSIYMLPNNKKDFAKFCKYLNKNHKDFFFILENKSITKLKNLKKIVKNYNLYKKLNKII